jgi:hypothetical protein
MTLHQGARIAESHTARPEDAAHELAPDRPASPRRSTSGWWLLSLVLLALAIAALRLRTYNEPLERDIVTYMFLGHVINQGGLAYDDAFEIKPPGVFMIYTAAEWLFGYGEREVYLLGVIAAILTLGGVYSAGATRGRAAGLWAAAFWTILCGAPTLQANQPNTEVFINACVVWALALMLRAGDSPGGVLRALAVGALLAFGSIIKQLVVIDAALLSLAYVAFCDGLPGGRRRAIRDVAIMAAVGAVCWFSVLAYFAAVGRFDFFWVTTFINSRAYAGNPLFNLFRYVREGKFFPRFLWFSAPVMALVLLGAIRDRRALAHRQWALYLTALVALQIKIALNGPGFLPHYYQYWLPMLAIGAGWAAGARSSDPRRVPPLAMSAVGALVYFIVLLQQGFYYLLPADEWSRLKYGSSIIDVRDLGRAIGEVLRPGETFYLHAPNAECYHYAGRFPLSLIPSTDCLNDTWPVSRTILERHLAALRKVRPDLIVIQKPEPPSPTPTSKPGLMGRLLGGASPVDQGRNAKAVLDNLLPKYRPARIAQLDQFTDYEFYILRGSESDGR